MLKQRTSLFDTTYFGPFCSFRIYIWQLLTKEAFNRRANILSSLSLLFAAANFVPLCVHI